MRGAFMLEPVLAWIEMHPGLAAWVQAVGVIGAIISAFLVPYFQRRLDRRDQLADRRLQAQAIALVTQADLLVLKGAIDRALKVNLLNSARVKLPPSILDNIERLWVMGNAGGAILQLVGTLNAHEALIDQGMEMLTFSYPNPDDLLRLARERLEYAREACMEALSHIETLLED
jgi:hypothetical protein